MRLSVVFVLLYAVEWCIITLRVRWPMQKLLKGNPFISVNHFLVYCLIQKSINRDRPFYVLIEIDVSGVTIFEVPRQVLLLVDSPDIPTHFFNIRKIFVLKFLFLTVFLSILRMSRHMECQNYKTDLSLQRLVLFICKKVLVGLASFMHLYCNIIS